VIVPSELVELAQWIAWWSVAGEGNPVSLPGGSYTKALKRQAKPHKLPINPKTGGLAATNRSETWAPFSVAKAAAEKWRLTGVGFVFTDSDPYAGVDIDNCRNSQTGEIADWAWDVIRALSSYTEVSPSGTGVHIIVRGSLPPKLGNQAAIHGGKVEMFSRARYFTFTGVHIPGTPAEIYDRSQELLALHAKLFAECRPLAPIASPACAVAILESDSELIDKARKAHNGSKFDQLWSGRWEGTYPSQSEADLALCCQLAFWTAKDPARIDSLFRQSGLMRPKWERQDYRDQTLSLALSTSGETYQGQRNGTKGISSSVPAGSDRESSPPDLPAPDLVYLPHTDTGNAERLARLYGNDIRFCQETKKWLHWDGKRWAAEDARYVKKLLKKTIRETFKQAADIEKGDDRECLERHARKSESAVAIKAALTCAEYEDGLSAPASMWDTQPYLLNFKNGTLDLLTGQLRAQDRRDLITRLVHFEYHADADCPRFLKFIHRIMGHDGRGAPNERTQRLVGYLQKCFGYSLTGDVSEKAVFCLFGSGDNGKTTLLEVVRFVIVEYSAQILIDSLIAHRARESSNCSADLADLRGARYVTTSESEEGHTLAIGKLKYLSQGMGEIKVCRKYENPITFAVSHKLFLDANHKPVVSASDEAIWKRLKAVFFEVTIPPSEIDKKLLDKLKTEAEGILAWMVEGCLRWMREGLGDPPEVSEATNAWRADFDNFQRFFNEYYVLDANAWVAVAEVWPTYQSWCNSNDEKVQLRKESFDKRLEALGCWRGARQCGQIRAWVGVRARTPEDEVAPASDEVTGSDAQC
jgi:putative DNA primase/helicase